MIFYLCDVVSFHKGRGRKVQPGQRLHSSIAFCEKDYYPKAILKDKYLFKLLGTGSRSNRDWARDWKGLLEMDIFDLSLMKRAIEELMSKTKDEKSMWAYRLCAMASTGRYLFCAKISVSNSEIQMKV